MTNYTIAINANFHKDCGISTEIQIFFVYANTEITAMTKALVLFIDMIKDRLDSGYLQIIADKTDSFLNAPSRMAKYTGQNDILRFSQMLSELGLNISITETLYKEGYDNGGTKIN
jgi:hypothetical protein